MLHEVHMLGNAGQFGIGTRKASSLPMLSCASASRQADRVVRRIVVIAVGLLAVDQVSKTLAGHLLADREVMLAPEWGLTYITNPGLWIWPDPPDSALYAIQGAGVGLAVLLALGARWYSRWYRRSFLVNVAVAFLALGVLGNLLDRLFIDGARDWVITPIATGNLADVAGWVTLALLVAELVVFPPSRRLLAIDPRQWRPAGPSDSRLTHPHEKQAVVDRSCCPQ